MIVFGLIAMLWPLVGLALGAWAIITIWRAVTLPRNAPKEPACERCKYPVTGLSGVSGFTCPECGGDLRRVGVITPAMELVRRGSATAAVLAWTVLYGIGGYLVLMMILLATNFSGMGGGVGSVTSWNHTLTPTNPLYKSVEIEYDSDWQSISGPIDITLTPNTGHPEALGLDTGPMTVLGLEGGPADWDDDTIELWFAQIGLDTNDPQVAAAAAELSNAIDLTIMAPGNAFTMNLTEHIHTLGPMAMTTPPGGGLFQSPGLLVALLVGAVGVYAAGVVLIVLRRRRLVRRAREAFEAG